MPIQLTHVGEELIAAMLDSLAKRRELYQVKCAISGRTLAHDMRQIGLEQEVHFRADECSLVIHNRDHKYACDGEQTVDVLCTGAKSAIAFEAKLGETRMGKSEFHKRFCGPCEISSHSDPRLRGSMIAVLERSLPFKDDSQLVAHADDTQWSLAKPWWLVLRQTVVDKWQKEDKLPVDSARVLVFDALAKAYGSRRHFDQLVHQVVGAEFANRWKMDLKSR